MSDIRNGDTVEWTSSAAGTSRTKRGEVVEVVPAYEWPRSAIDGAAGGRNHESYVVHAEALVRKGRRLYWPRVSALRLVERAGGAS